MYANLKVSMRRDSDPSTDETVAAYQVSIIGPTATVFLDDPDSESSYAEPVGERVVDLSTTTLTIEADF